jgi:hypothetical protein
MMFDKWRSYRRYFKRLKRRYPEADLRVLRAQAYLFFYDDKLGNRDKG